MLVKGKRIADLLPESATVEGARVLDCQGKLLLPGLIDVHWHTMLAAIPQMTAMTADLGYLYLVAAKEAQRTLMRASPRCATRAGRRSRSSARSTRGWWTARASIPAER